MRWAFEHLWLVPVLPLAAAILIALSGFKSRVLAAGLAIGSMLGSLALSIAAFVLTWDKPATSDVWREVRNFDWLPIGGSAIELGWVLDPLAAVMLVMVTFVGLLIFIYSIGYMTHDRSFARFFCCLSLFAAAMLGLIISNSMLLLFICWELVGVASYLLIGFWYHKPEAAAAAQKAFITTRVGDIGLFLGMLWLSTETGTLLFYDQGAGCMESSSIAALLVETTGIGMAVSTGICLLIFCGAIGKSGQVPLHVWLPDAMEGPTPVSALIHAATMVAAGVFLVARVYPLMEADGGLNGFPAPLTVVTWVGAITAVFAAAIAVAQTDIKRILAYSTVSQLGFMMMGLGVGGVEVGIFHLITHAFFKALLFLGAGSVIHGCHEEQDIRRMGGLRKIMPWTFVTYAIGMLALSGFPLFSGFWSKDEILHAAHLWEPSKIPFYLGLIGSFLTAFYMTRQVCHVFFGTYRGETGHDAQHSKPHESPLVMTVPLMILAVFALGLGLLGTPAYPMFEDYLTGSATVRHVRKLLEPEIRNLLIGSSIIVFAGLIAGWYLYGRKKSAAVSGTDPLEVYSPTVFNVLRNKFFVDELYRDTAIKFHSVTAAGLDWMDRWVWGGIVLAVSYVFVGLAYLDRFFDEYVLNLGFAEVCNRITRGGGFFSRLQTGQVQDYLRVIAVALSAFLLLLSWGCGK